MTAQRTVSQELGRVADLAGLERTLAAALGDDASFAITQGLDSTAASLTVDLGDAGLESLEEVQELLAAALGARLPFSIEMQPGASPLLRMELKLEQPLALTATRS